MKILSAEQIRNADEYTIANEPIASIDLMERAATASYQWLVHNELVKGKIVHVVCGIGNNGGDGLVIARLLKESGHSVHVCAIRFSENASEDFKVNEGRLQEIGLPLHDVFTADDLPQLAPTSVVIDAIFGTGLARQVEGFVGEIINRINHSKAQVIAIDMPSGLFTEDNGANNGAIIKATFTLTFQLPKLAFMFPENSEYAGQWHVISIGLHPEFIKQTTTPFHYLTRPMLAPLLIKRTKFAHKGTFGHSLLVSGAEGKMGATIMAAKACLRSGTGLLTVHCPKSGVPILQEALPEAMCEPDEDDAMISQMRDLKKFKAIGVGPGIGTNKQTGNALKLLIQNTPCPLVIDADAINLISENLTWVAFVPANSIYTPHLKEFERLVGKSDNHYERLQLQIEFSEKNCCFVVLKGAHTAISCPDGSVYFNSTGNPGMAKGGSGDALTGMITGLLAQGYSSQHAALLGVYLHGLAGDIAAEKTGEEAMITTDLIDAIGLAINELKD